MSKSIEFTLEPQDPERLAALCGELNQNLRLIEKTLHINISNRAYALQISGDEGQVEQARFVLEALYRRANKVAISPEEVHLALRDAGASSQVAFAGENPSAKSEISIETKRGLITGRGDNQRAYLKRIFQNAVNFGIGPAGTGKTYLAVAAAINFLAEDKVRRIVLVRPAVEAGERLGFLPGDMSQKVVPYLRPLYDALNDMLGTERVLKYIERGTIEIAPLAFMRGRTLNEAFIILDEAQNTTIEQMKMFLTRLGFGSTAVITGDISQIDLPPERESGLKHARKVLQDIEGISWTSFSSRDVVRYPLVVRIVDAYAKFQAQNPAEKKNFQSNP